MLDHLKVVKIERENWALESPVLTKLLTSSQCHDTSTMAYTCLIVLDPEIPFTLPEMKGISGTDGANYKAIK